MTLLEFTYLASWYPSTDAGGFSLEIEDDTVPVADWNLAANWQPSSAINGSPGSANGSEPLPEPGAVIVNEVLTNTTSVEGDWIELYNTTQANIDIGGWFLSDDLDTPMKFRIDAGTMIPAGGYIVFTADNHFGPTSSHPGKLIAFSLSSAGDEVVLSSGSSGALTGYQESEDFAGADPEVTFGQTPRVDGSTPFTALRIPTQGAINSAPRVDEVVISEINYAPNVGNYEYLEITNRSSETIPPFDPDNHTNTWQMTNGVSYAFPQGLSLDPGCQIILVPFDPVTQSLEFNDFMTVYQVPPGVGVLGPYAGALSNTEERVSLSRPGPPDPLPPNMVPVIVADSVKFNSVSPWPTEAAGGEASLDRIALGNFADDGVNWQSELGGSPGDGPPDGFGLWLQSQYSLNALADPSQQALWKPGSDADHDGLSLLHEYFYALDPTAPTTDDGLDIAPGGTTTKMAYRRAKTLSGTSLVIMYSDDNMATWNSISHTDAVISDEGTYNMMEAIIMQGSDDQDSLFFRLDVTRP